MEQLTNFENVVNSFNTDADFLSTRPFGSGHIHDTFLLDDRSGAPAFILQQINGHVFPDIPALMCNIDVVTRHLRYKAEGTTQRTLELVPLRNGELFYRDGKGTCWRMYHYLKNTRSYDRAGTAGQAAEAGKAFGRFQALLADLPAGQLTETIPGFMSCRKRLEDLEMAVFADSAGRVREVSEQVAAIRGRAAKMDFLRESTLPLRVVHNDTKFNNVLLDLDDRACCVVDLDTVMPGYVACDFGDAVRTIINRAAEDEPEPENVRLDMGLFEAFAQGYLSEAVAFLQAGEMESLVQGVLLLPYLQAVRFLTDYLEGDHYYKIKFEHHNLQRANAQLALLYRLEEARDRLASVIRHTWAAQQKKPNS